MEEYQGGDAAPDEAAELPLNTILVGDVRDQLRSLPPSSVDCVITSPPYFGLRNYGRPGQIGLEPDVHGWVEQIRMATQAIARVLKPSGSLWLNVADSYSAHPGEGTAKKSLLLGPQRLSLALAADGWTVRNQVVWAKANPMPSSATDRLSCTYELLLFLVRSPRYYFNLDAVRIPLTGRRPPARHAPPSYPPAEAAPSVSGFNRNDGLGKLRLTGRIGHVGGKNPGDVWTLPTAGFRGAHFAAFPPGLITRPLLATCPERLCSVCGSPWRGENGEPDKRSELAPACRCGTSYLPGVVLDPFIGSGTTASVAEQHGRAWIGIELNPEYARLAEERLAQWRERAATGRNTADP